MKPALRSIFENEVGSDLTLQLISGKGEKLLQPFRVHKCILAVRSKVLASHIHKAEENHKEKKQNLSSVEVKVTQVKGENVRPMFALMLEWIYSASLEIPPSVQEVADLYFLSYEFKVFDLLTRCEHELINRISPKSVIDVLLVFFPR